MSSCWFTALICADGNSWCNPCKMLMPRIESVVQETNGKIDLAKVSAAIAKKSSNSTWDIIQFSSVHFISFTILSWYVMNVIVLLSFSWRRFIKLFAFPLSLDWLLNLMEFSFVFPYFNGIHRLILMNWAKLPMTLRYHLCLFWL